jgi:hypothetical protein
MNSLIAQRAHSLDQLDRHPELGPLAILEMAIEVATSSLAAVHPELWLEDEHGPLDHKVPVQVHRLLAQATRLRRASARYQSYLDERDAQERNATPNSDDGLPF